MNVSATRHDDTAPWATLLAAGLIVLATAAAFSDSLGGPFILDDGPSIPDNPTIRRLWPHRRRRSARRSAAKRSPAGRC